MNLPKTIDIITSILYPHRCPVCDDAVPLRQGLVCNRCKDIWKPVGGRICVKCGRQLFDDARLCDDCAEGTHAFTRGFSLYPYHEVSASIYRFKYMGRREYAAFFAEELLRRYGTMLPALSLDAIVPVPLHESRLRKRGYNQAQELAEELGKRLHLPVMPQVLLRCRATAPQKTLSRAERRINLENAFKTSQNSVKLKTILLVDDIYTTGATMDAAAEVLRRAGISRVYCLTIATGS